MNKSRSGFTIVELLIVIVVIGILAAITIMTYNGVKVRARVGAEVSGIKVLEKALGLYYAENNAYPACNGAAYVPGDIVSVCTATNLSTALVPKYINSLPTGMQDVAYFSGTKKLSPDPKTVSYSNDSSNNYVSYKWLADGSSYAIGSNN